MFFQISSLLFAAALAPSCSAFSVTPKGTGLKQNGIHTERVMGLGATTQQTNDIFAPFKNMFGGGAPAGPKASDFDEEISQTLEILYEASETKTDDTEKVFNALQDLEKLQRQKRKLEASAGVDTTAREMLDNLAGDWRLVFTTGTADSQKKIGGRINYFPIKAVQSFDPTTEPMAITNGIFLGNIEVIKFFGPFEFDLKKCKVEFDFDKIAVLGFGIDLPKGKAAELGSASGLGSKNNVKLAEQKKKPFFNWVSADAKVATARGGGGGLALWKRVVEE